jgi:PhnB protein
MTFQLNTYLNFEGNTQEAFEYYQSILGGSIENIQKFKDSPMASSIEAADQDKIMHISLRLPSGHIMMGTDALESFGHKLNFGNHVYLSIHPSSRDEAKRIFQALSDGGKVEMPLQDTFWGAYYASFTDKYGIQWMINHQS